MFQFHCPDPGRVCMVCKGLVKFLEIIRPGLVSLHRLLVILIFCSSPGLKSYPPSERYPSFSSCDIMMQDLILNWIHPGKLV